MTKTEAYEEITDGRCPLANNRRSVQTFLDYLVSKNVLTRKQSNYLLSNINKLELGHCHGLPKPYKVSWFDLCSSLFFPSSLEYHYDQLLLR